MGKTHWKGEPSTCCHVHAEDLPENHQQRGEVEDVPVGWTAQAQAAVDQLTDLAAKAEERAEAPRHRHMKENDGREAE